MILNRFFVFDIEEQQPHVTKKISICYLWMKHLEIETRTKLDWYEWNVFRIILHCQKYNEYKDSDGVCLYST